MAIATHASRQIYSDRPLTHKSILKFTFQKRSATFFLSIVWVRLLLLFSCSVRNVETRTIWWQHTHAWAETKIFEKSDRLTSSPDCLCSFFCSWVFMDSSAQFVRARIRVWVHVWKYVWVYAARVKLLFSVCNSHLKDECNGTTTKFHGTKTRTQAKSI